MAIAPGTIGDSKNAILTPSEVEFEILVSVSENSAIEKNGGAKINVLSGLFGVDGGIKKADEGNKSLTHKLAFKVPVHFNAQITY